MPVLDQRGFYRLWAQKTFTPALRVTGLVSLVVGIVAAFLTARWPTLGALGMQLRWVLPVSAFTAFLVYRLFHGAFILSFTSQYTRITRKAQVPSDC